MAAAEDDAKVLPIRRFADDIVAAVRGNDTVTVIGETGSGKTTQLAQVAHGRAGLSLGLCVSRCKLSMHALHGHARSGCKLLTADARWLTDGCALHGLLQILLDAKLAEGGVVAVTQPRRVVGSGFGAMAGEALNWCHMTMRMGASMQDLHQQVTVTRERRICKRHAD